MAKLHNKFASMTKPHNMWPALLLYIFARVCRILRLFRCYHLFLYFLCCSSTWMHVTEFHVIQYTFVKLDNTEKYGILEGIVKMDAFFTFSNIHATLHMYFWITDGWYSHGNGILLFIVQWWRQQKKLNFEFVFYALYESQILK